MQRQRQPLPPQRRPPRPPHPEPRASAVKRAKDNAEKGPAKQSVRPFRKAVSGAPAQCAGLQDVTACICSGLSCS